jgi:hypothetical protein
VVPHQAPTATLAPITTATTLVRGVSLVAQATRPLVQIYDDPSAPAPSTTLPNLWLLNGDATKPVMQVFLIQQRRAGWIQVLLPERPNGSTGWVHAHTEITTLAKILPLGTPVVITG